jgi:hypothetical protein
MTECAWAVARKWLGYWTYRISTPTPQEVVYRNVEPQIALQYPPLQEFLVSDVELQIILQWSGHNNPIPHA